MISSMSPLPSSLPLHMSPSPNRSSTSSLSSLGLVHVNSLCNLAQSAALTTTVSTTTSSFHIESNGSNNSYSNANANAHGQCNNVLPAAAAAQQALPAAAVLYPTNVRRAVTRADFVYARRIIVKLGTSVVSTAAGEPAIGRIATIIEQICDLKRQGKQVLLVTSGSIGIGKLKLDKQLLLSASLRTHIQGSRHGNLSLQMPEISRGAYAAAGQIGLMSLYETLFSLYDVACSQVLVTDGDFTTQEKRNIMRGTLNNLLDLGVLPIVNENDAVSAAMTSTSGTIFADNDSLAALCAGEIGADLLLLLTDVDGLYTKPPSEAGAKVISTFKKSTNKFKIGAKSAVGRGGMGSKIEAAQSAIDRGVQAVVIASGYKNGIINQVVKGLKVGTLFVENTNALDEEEGSSSSNLAEGMAINAREASRSLQALTTVERQRILKRIAGTLVDKTEDILAANSIDLQEAQLNKLDTGLISRLKLTRAKIATLSEGILAIANAPEPIGRLLSQTEVSDGLVLQQQTCPIGVLLIIFESRPDSLPQIACLAIRSGNGLLLKGGKEAMHSNAMLHQLIVSDIATETQNRVSKNVIGLVTSRDEVSHLLELDHVIDLCIPRGSGALVKYIKNNTRIPVLGHAEGVCHVFVHHEANIDLACKIVLDSKIDYPSACNALETLLIDLPLIQSGGAAKLFNALQHSGVTLMVGPKIALLNLIPYADNAESMSEEYGSLTLTVEIVDGLTDAIAHINLNGSHHTESIVTENKTIAETFISDCDSACVFHNASTRFADGFRFGLGAEVGISTGRIHARGPVGVEGLLTTKWILRSESGHTVAMFKPNATPKQLTYTHKTLDLNSRL